MNLRLRQKAAIPAEENRRRAHSRAGRKWNFFWWIVGGIVLFLSGRWDGEASSAPARGSLSLPKPREDLIFIQSSSGQFDVLGPKRPQPLSTVSLSKQANSAQDPLILLHPEAVVVGCERVRQLVGMILQIPSSLWHGKVHVILNQRILQPDIALVRAKKGLGRWNYFVEFSLQVRRETFVRAIVGVLLVDLAHNTPGPYEPEVPVWLREAIVEEILATAATQVLPSKEGPLRSLQVGVVWQAFSDREYRYSDQWAAIILEFRKKPPLTFTELSFPVPADLEGEKGKHYRRSARLFLRELLRLPGGGKRILRMLGGLSHRLNWQFAFLDAYRPIFRSILDVEKWWAVASTRFIYGTVVGIRNEAASLFRMDQALTVVLLIRRSPNELPQREVLPLTKAIRRVPSAQLPRLLRMVEKRLLAAGVGAPPRVRDLLLRYLGAIRGFLNEWERGAIVSSARGYVMWEQQRVLDELFSRLADLDREREALEKKAPFGG